MTQEDKELLLKDLGARLSYKVVAQVSYKDGEGWKTEDRKVLGVYTDEQVYVDCVYTNIKNTKPYLRPMSSMTEDEEKEIRKINHQFYKEDGSYITAGVFAADDCGCTVWEMVEILNYLNQHHFDYRGLIEKGLAIAVTSDNNPYNV